MPAGIWAEIASMLEHRLGVKALDLFVQDLIAGAYSPDCGLDDLPRIRALITRYADLPLGFADASVVACAERNGGKVLTLDRRDFGVVSRGEKIQILPE